MNQNDLRVKKTLKLLSDALRELMCEKPFEKISVVDICDRAMVHRATFYAHFEDKYHLLRYTLSELESPLDKDDITAHDFEGYKKYYLDAAYEILTILSKNQKLYKNASIKNREESVITSIRATISMKICEKLERCRESGIKMPVPPEIISRFCGGGAMNVIEWWIVNDMPIPPEKIIEYIGNLLPDFD